MTITIQEWNKPLFPDFDYLVKSDQPWTGISLRQYFSAMALTAIAPDLSVYTNLDEFNQILENRRPIAEAAVKIADATLEYEFITRAENYG